MKHLRLRGAILALTVASTFLVVSVALATAGFTGPYELQQWSKAGGGTTTITPASGPATSAEFGYALTGGAVYSPQYWTFAAPAAADGTASFDWQYSGYHAFYFAVAGLQAFADGPAGRMTVTLRASQPSSGGFSDGGSTSIAIHSGYPFGVIASGSNSDGDARLQGTITLANFQVVHAPAAANDSYSATKDTPLVVAGPGVLANDTDADGDPLTASVVADPAHGTLTLNADGSFIYTPTTGYHGPDSFTYKVNDGIADSNTATVTIRTNAPPAAVADSYTTDAGTGLPVTNAANGVLANDTDADGDPLTASAVTQPANGTLFLFASGLNADGTFTYYPNIGFVGVDSFTYKVNDGTVDGNTVTVTITVNALPVAANDTYTAIQDTPLTKDAAAGVRANDTGSGTLTASVVADPTHGTLTLNADGSFIYTPTTGYHGPDSFTYKINDGIADSSTATVSLTVDATPVAVADAYTAQQNTPLVAGNSIGVLANDSDADADPLTAVLASGPAHGTLALNPDGSFVYTPVANYTGPDSFTYTVSDGARVSNVATVSIRVNAPPVAVADSYATAPNTPLTVAAPGVLANDTDADSDPLTAAVVAAPAHGTLALNADGSFVYTPVANYTGPDSFTYTVSDGARVSNVATVTLAVATGNRAPVAANDAYGTTQGVALTIGAPGVLANDTDPDANTLAAVLASGPAHGTLTLNPNGSFTYTPASGFSGADSFTYRASDGTAQSAVAMVTIQVGGSATLTLSASGPGTVAANPAAPTQPAGTVVTLTPSAQGGALFIGWMVDGRPGGWAPILTITLDRDHTVVARFAAPVAFSDLAPTDPAASAIRELTARGIINGYGDGRFGPTDTLQRAQAAALVVRGLDWSGERYVNPFTDQPPVDDELWRSVGILAHYNVARGFGDGTYHPTEAVDHAQFISLVTRAMVAQGYWVQQPDVSGRFPAVGETGHRQDLITYQHYVGGFPDLTEGSDAASWFGPASRGWASRALWAALNQYQQVDRTP